MPPSIILVALWKNTSALRSSKDFSEKFGGITSNLVAFAIYECLFYSNSEIVIDQTFNCFAEVKKSGQHTKDLQLSDHPPLVCRIAFGLSLGEAQEEMKKLFGGEVE